MQAGEGWRVSVTENGRDGSVHYDEGGETLSFYWAFGGGDVVASIAIGDEAEWRAKHGWAAPRRDEIIARIIAEVIHQRTPTSTGEVDASGRFINFIAAGAPFKNNATPPPLPRAAPQSRVEREAAASMVWRLNKVKSRMAMILLALTAIAFGALLFGKTFLTVKTTGSPAGASARAGEFIATPIIWLEPYAPSPDRRGGQDRYSAGLLIHSLRDEKFRRYVPVSRGQQGGALSNTKIDGAAGDIVWFNAPDEVAINARTGRILSADEARAAPRPERRTGAGALFDLASADRRLEAMTAAPGEAGTPTPDGAKETFVFPKFLRAAPHGNALMLEGGDFLLTFETRRYPPGNLVVARIAPSGEMRWRAETPIGALQEAFPDADFPALVGARPREEGKVSEPLLVIIDAKSGALAAHSLIVR